MDMDGATNPCSNSSKLRSPLVLDVQSEPQAVALQHADLPGAVCCECQPRLETSLAVQPEVQSPTNGPSSPVAQPATPVAAAAATAAQDDGVSNLTPITASKRRLWKIVLVLLGVLAVVAVAVTMGATLGEKVQSPQSELDVHV
jgi:hypothetical protein